MEYIINTLITVGSFIVLLAIIIGIHELGHFLAARFFNVHVIRFKIGFGKTIYSKVDNQDTEFSIGLLPLGGYVQMLGETAPQENIGSIEKNTIGNKRISYSDISLGARAVITAAGPIANFILAILVYILIFLIGTKELGPFIGEVEENSLGEKAGLDIGSKVIRIDSREIFSFNEINISLAKRVGDTGTIEIDYSLKDSDIVLKGEVKISDWLREESQINAVSSFGIKPFIPALIGSLQEDGPAKKAGLKVGDLIIRVDDKNIDSWLQLTSAITSSSGDLSIQVTRKGAEYSYSVTPSILSDDNGKRLIIGIGGITSLDDLPEELVILNKKNFFEAISASFVSTYQFTILILDSIGKMVTGSVSVENIGGPIQISLLASSAAKAGFVSFLSMIAVLSINLGLLNLLPIPILDGGQLVLIAIEKIKGSPVSDSFLEYSYRIGIFLVGSLMFFAIFNDILRII